MPSNSDGQNAIKELNEKTVQDRKIIVNEARPPKPRTGGGGGGGGRNFRR
ncbi:MAG: RNA-binding protein [Deltaproteobacteria bacterium]|nr:RNA-binding protein [Deltaproteobacteria bacterium]